MKTKFYYVLALFCAALTLANLSCVNEVVGTDSESSPVVDPEAIWEYRGESQVVPKVIAELKSNSANKVQMEDRLLNNDVLWEEAVFLLVENKKRILVPVLSYSKSNIIAVLSLVRNKAGKTQWGVTFRWDLAKKNVQLPFWEASRWQGYFEALDAELLGIDNGSPGIMERPIENLKTSGKSALQAKSADWEQHCITYRVEYCYKQALCGPGFENCDYDNAETIYCTYSYEPECYNVYVGSSSGGDSGGDSGGGSSGGGSSGGDSGFDVEDFDLFDEVSTHGIDLKPLLDCFTNIDILSPSTTYTLTVYVEQPKPNTRETWALAWNGANPGHTFISLSINDPIIPANNFTQTFGFYPEKSVNPTSTKTAKGEIRNNSGHVYHVSASIDLDNSGFYNTINYINQLINPMPQYHLDNYNCTDFAIRVANNAGMGLPDSSGVWKHPITGNILGSGSNPGDLGQDVRTLNNPSVAVNAVSAGSGPNGHGPCN